MTERFRATIRTDRQAYMESGAVISKRTRAGKILIAVGLIYILTGIGGLIIDYGYLRIAKSFLWIICGSVILGVRFFYPFILGRKIKKASEKKFSSVMPTYYFNEEDIHIVSELENSSVSYAAIKEIVETENVFMLFVNKNTAFCIPKNCIENLTCDARDFFERKIGKPVIKQKTITKGKALLRSIAVFLAASVFIASYSTYQEIKMSKPEKFEFENYSVTLDGHFYDDYEEDDYFAIYSEIVSIDIYRQTEKDAMEEYNCKSIDLKSYTEHLYEWLQISDGSEIKKLDDNALYFTYSDGDEIYNSYYFVCVHYADGVFWETDFCCAEGMRNIYEEQILEWAKTVKIKDGVKIQ